MRQRATVSLLLCCLVMLGTTLMYAAGPAISPKPRQQGTDGQITQRGEQDIPKPDPELERKMAKARLTERYTDLKRDSEKLLEMATELKQYVDKSNEQVLSMDVIKKCEEIEKLAKRVRTKMKGE
jgi:hypothetical protein